MKARSLLLSLCACGFFCSTPSQAASYGSLYIFGDSLADTGNNAWVFDVAVPAMFGDSHPYAYQRTEAPISAGNDEVDMSLVPTFPYTSNRYSNGGVWPDYVSAMTGLPTQAALAGLSFSQAMSGQINGTNFAFGGARVGSTPPLGFPFSLVDQVSAYALLLNGNPAPSNALFIVEGGGNDVRDVFAAAIDGDPTTDPNALIQNYLDGMTTVLNTLAYVGAQHIAVWNVPDIGKVPAVQALGPVASALATQYAMAMNSGLQSVLDNSGYSGSLGFFDVFATLDLIVTNPGDYGLTNVSDPCAVSIACVNDPSGYLFWDGIHPTTYGHRLLATAFVNAMRMPEPGTLWLMLVAVLPAVFRQRSARL